MVRVRTRETAAARTARPMLASTTDRSIWNSRWAKGIWLPWSRWLIWVPATAAMAMGIRLAADHSPRITSTVKIRPAMGALKMDPMAPAAPQPTRTTRWRSLRVRKRAMLDPMAAPLITTGASGPADPPLPMVRQLETSREKLERRRSRPP
jgi:hypothetical protein